MFVLSSLLWSFGLAVAGVGITLHYARHHGLVDVPNQRSSHSTPTPRGGGIALVGAVFGVTLWRLWRVPSAGVLAWVFLGVAALILTAAGWLDDRQSVPVRVRLPIHLLCGLAVAVLVNELAPVPGPLNLAWLALCIVWTVASINIVNFMDGIDGMVAVQGVVFGAYLYVLLPEGMPGATFGVILSSACLGFLVWNWPRAKIFLGDVGSGPLGLFFAIGGVFALEGAPLPLVFLPLFPLFFDSLITMILRFRRGETLTSAHRSHLYQRAANGGAGHAMVTMAYGVVAAIGALVALAVRNAAHGGRHRCLCSGGDHRLEARRHPLPPEFLSLERCSVF